MGALAIRPLQIDDEQSVGDAHAELAREGFDFLLDVRAAEPWPAYVNRVSSWSDGEGLPEGWLPGTFLVGTLDDVVVGRVSIRHKLTTWLAEVGGHIGYAVRPNYRRRGYASTLLSHALEVARVRELDRVLLTCDEDNVGSTVVIERCGGVFERLTDPVDGQRKRRYWIDL